MRSTSTLFRIRRAAASGIGALLAMGLIGSAVAQERQSYLMGEGQRLQFVVHILGEVRAPGEYTVLDRTTVIELVSKAGGPTEYAGLANVRLTRVEHRPVLVAGAAAGVADDSTYVLHLNLDDFLNGKDRRPALVLQPGDIVTVPSNGWSRWRRISGIARDLSVVASAYFLYLRAVKNN
jgi:protein involved in polysaccharide export with SLBB domain